MRIRWILLVVFACVTLSGCWSAAASEPSGASVVSITNASTVLVTDVHVATGPDDELFDASIAAGATTNARPVRIVHANIYVTAKVGNQSVSVIPIEGFSDGFNPRLPNGTYSVVLTVHVENDGTYWLEASIQSQA